MGRKGFLKFLRATVRPEGTILMTDEFASYNAASDYMQAVINHKKSYAGGLVRTNSIEGFWSLVKRAWYGSHHHYTKRFMPLFIAESCWKHNHRRNADGFGSFLRGCFA